MDDIKQFVELLKLKFKERMSKKTGWGRNEIWFEFNIAIAETLLEMARSEITKSMIEKNNVPF